MYEIMFFFAISKSCNTNLLDSSFCFLYEDDMIQI